jgi:hypothetical protein
MHSDEIERRLRMPAHDEPSFLPPLLLPQATGFDLTGGRIRAGSAGASLRLLSPRLVLALVALLAALAAATVSGAIRLDRLPNPFLPQLSFAGDGVSIDYPDNWVQLTPEDPGGMSSAFTSLVVANRAVPGCSAEELDGARVGGNAVPFATQNPGVVITPAPGESGPTIIEVPEPDGPTYSGVEDAIFACIVDAPMASGEIRVALSLGPPQEIGIGPIETFDAEAWYGEGSTLGDLPFEHLPTAEGGWTEEIDGMPAKLVVTAGSAAEGSDEVRTWGVYDPLRFDSIWLVRTSLRGPDLDELRAQADSIAKSLHFDARPPVLDASKRDQAMATIIDKLDREQREFGGSRLMGCFPRTPGEQTVVLEDGPRGPLLEPATVTCTTSVEETPLHLWRVELRITWPATDGYAAGTLGWELFFGAEDGLGAQGQIGNFDEIVFPGTVSPAAAPVDSAPELAPGTIVQMLAPGIRQGDPLVTGSWNDPHPDMADRFVYEAQPGRRFAIVDGPISHNGAEWYLVEAAMGVSYPGDFQWLPVTDGNRLLVRVEEPACPRTPSVVDLAYLLPAERASCYAGQELRLAPAFASKVDRNTSRVVAGTPAWLSDSQWRLYGEDGPTGLDGPILVAIDPAIGESLPTDVPLTVTGHFGDPAAASCDGQVPEGLQPETPQMQHLRCSEVFVITAIEEGATQ